MNEKDLRVVKTKKAIRDTFHDMVMEMDYEDITIKELTMRARINRKTFYLHYRDIDNLLEEMQNEIVNIFLEKNISYENLKDIRSMVRVFCQLPAACRSGGLKKPAVD